MSLVTRQHKSEWTSVLLHLKATVRLKKETQPGNWKANTSQSWYELKHDWILRAHKLLEKFTRNFTKRVSQNRVQISGLEESSCLNEVRGPERGREHLSIISQFLGHLGPSWLNSNYSDIFVKPELLIWAWDVYHKVWHLKCKPPMAVLGRTMMVR